MTTETETCPKCGAKWERTDAFDWQHYDCGTMRTPSGDWIEGPRCLERQLAQRDARIAELELENQKLRDREQHVRSALVLFRQDDEKRWRCTAIATVRRHLCDAVDPVARQAKPEAQP